MTKALIVLGGGLDRQGDMPAWVIARLNKAIEVWRSGGFSLLVTTGKGRAEAGETEASAMKRYLVEHSLPIESIETEGESTSTIENAYYCRTEHIQPKGITDITIVTNQFHIKRAESIFKFIFGENYEVRIAAASDNDISPEDHAVLVEADQEQAQFLIDHIFNKFEAGNLSAVKTFIFDKENDSAKAWTDYKANSGSYKKATELMT